MLLLLKMTKACGLYADVQLLHAHAACLPAAICKHNKAQQRAPFELSAYENMYPDAI
jgi:hypothetical protein